MEELLRPGAEAGSGRRRADAVGMALVALYVASLLIANTTAGKVTALGQLSVPAAIYIFALTFTVIDLINEHFGKVGARWVVLVGFAANVLMAAYYQLAIALPPAPFFEGQEAFARVLGQTPRIVGASFTAYLAASLVDVEIFAWWRAHVGGAPAARVFVSNLVSTLLDSVVFVTLAFWGVLPVLPIMVGQYVVKMAVTVVSLPLIYGLRALYRRADVGEAAQEVGR